MAEIPSHNRIEITTTSDGNSRTSVNITTMENDGSEMSDSVVLAILEAVATARDVDPIELPPLADHLDPDALHQLIESANTDLHVKMSIYGCRIEIDQHGTVKAEREFHE